MPCCVGGATARTPLLISLAARTILVLLIFSDRGTSANAAPDTTSPNAPPASSSVGAAAGATLPASTAIIHPTPTTTTSCGQEGLPQINETFFQTRDNVDHLGSPTMRTFLFKDVCMVGRALVLHDPHNPEAFVGMGVPVISLTGIRDSFAHGFQRGYHDRMNPLQPMRKISCSYGTLPIRYPTKAEATSVPPSAFTNCTLPVILLAARSGTFGEALAVAPSALHRLQNKEGAMGQGVTLLQGSCKGAPLDDFHMQLIQPFSDRPVDAWEAFARDTIQDPLSHFFSSAPPLPPPRHLCFSRLAVVGIYRSHWDLEYETSQHLLRHYQTLGKVPPESKVFESGPDILKVLFLHRRGDGGEGSRSTRAGSGQDSSRAAAENSRSNPADSNLNSKGAAASYTEGDPGLEWMRRQSRSLPEAFRGRPIYPGTRQILNLEELLEACRNCDWSEVLNGTRWKGVECRPYSFRDLFHVMSVMQQIDILVSLHGSEEMYGMFMRRDTIKVQLRQRGILSAGPHHRVASHWPDLCEANGFPFQCYFVNSEEEDAWEPGIFERLGLRFTNQSETAAWKDRHLRLKFGHLVHVLKEILPIQGNRSEYLKRWRRCHVTWTWHPGGNVTHGSHLAHRKGLKAAGTTQDVFDPKTAAEYCPKEGSGMVTTSSATRTKAAEP